MDSGCWDGVAATTCSRTCRRDQHRRRSAQILKNLLQLAITIDKGQKIIYTDFMLVIDDNYNRKAFVYVADMAIYLIPYIANFRRPHVINQHHYTTKHN